jgi:hypothetical protein
LDQVVPSRDRDGEIAERDLQRAFAQLWKRRGARGFVQHVDVSVRRGDLPEGRAGEHPRVDGEMLTARVEDSRTEISQGFGEAFEVHRAGCGDQIDVVGHAHVTVHLHGDASDDNVLDSVGIEHGEDALGVERSPCGRRPVGDHRPVAIVWSVSVS